VKGCRSLPRVLPLSFPASLGFRAFERTAAFVSRPRRLPAKRKKSRSGLFTLRGIVPVMAVPLDRLTYDALPVAKPDAPFNLAGIECAEDVPGQPVVLVGADKALYQVPPSLQSIASSAHAAVASGAPLPSKPGRLDRALEKLASGAPLPSKPVDVLVEHIADRLDENGSLSGILPLVADEIAARMKTSELVAKLASEFEEEVVSRLPRAVFDRIVNPRSAKRRRVSSDQARLT